MASRGLTPPWPDLIVSCGRRAVPYALAARSASRGRILIAHVQDPRRKAAAFDLVVAMDHDRIRPGPRVIKVSTALHDLTPALLARAAEPWRQRFAALGDSLAGVIVGGDLKGRPFTRDDGGRLLDGLRLMREASGIGFAITPSRRTPRAVRELMHRAFDGDPRVFLWDLVGDNPYRAILGSADRLVVTGDSVSMISEAISTTAPVDVLDLGFPRHAGFLQTLIESGRVRRFSGDAPTSANPVPVNATNQAAAVLRRLLAARGVQA